jgi:acid phosphatase type 7
MRAFFRRNIPFILVILLVMMTSALAFAQESSPLIWGPDLGAIGTDNVSITWNTSRAVGADLRYSTAKFYDATGSWDETLSFSPHEGMAEIHLTDLTPGTTYRYQLVIYEGDALYTSPVGHFTTSSPDLPTFSFLVYGDTRTNQDQNGLVCDTMAADEPNAAFVVSTGDLVESPTIGRFTSFFSAIADLALSHPYLAVIGNHEKGSPYYYRFLALPTGGGDSNEEWWSFDYGNVHFVGIDSNTLTGANAIQMMKEQLEWVKNDLANSQAEFKIVFFHHPIYSSTWGDGVNAQLQQLWEPIFRETGVDIVFNGHMHCYEHLYVNGIHYIVTGGGGAPLQETVDNNVASGTVFRRYGTLHYMRVTVSGNMIRVDAIPVASVYNDEVHLVPSGRPMDSFTITKP